MATPVVTIFVRHSADCRYKGEGFHKQCRCRKHLRWSHNGRQFFQSAKTRSWEAAETEKKRVESQFDSTLTPEQAAAIAKPEGRKTIAQAIESFTLAKTNQEIDGSVLAAHVRELARLEAFMSKRGRFFPAEISLDDLEAFRATWKDYSDSSLTRRVYQTRLNEWLRYCYDDKLIDRVPKLKAINAEEPPTLPLIDNQYEKLLAAVPVAFGPVRKNRPSAATVRAVIQLMRYSGLAVTDASALSKSNMVLDAKRNLYRVFVSRQKTGTDVSVLLPRFVSDELLALTNENPAYFAWDGQDRKTHAARWSHMIAKVFSVAFPIPEGHPEYCQCHPRGSHQLRDTFAVENLKKGVPLEEVSKMLGHSSIRTTEKHYAAWVQSRQDRLDSLVVGTWETASLSNHASQTA